MVTTARQIDPPVSLEEFDTRYGPEDRVQLIDGVVVNQAFPSDEHGILAATLAELLGAGLRRSSSSCRPSTGSGLAIRGSDHGLSNDFFLGPDLQVQCRNDAGDRVPVLVVEILSPSNTASEMNDKLRAYTKVPSITDILILEQNKMAATHHRRRDDTWLGPLYLSRPEDMIILDQWSIELSLEQIYADLAL